MEETKRGIRAWLKERKRLIQGLALIMILALPFLLHVLAQADQGLGIGLGVALMALVMIVLVIMG